MHGEKHRWHTGARWQQQVADFCLNDGQNPDVVFVHAQQSIPRVMDVDVSLYLVLLIKGTHISSETIVGVDVVVLKLELLILLHSSY